MVTAVTTIAAIRFYTIYFVLLILFLIISIKKDSGIFILIFVTFIGATMTVLAFCIIIYYFWGIKTLLM